MLILDDAQDLKERRMHGFFDDFEWYVITHRWTSLKADTNTTMDVDATSVGGRVLLFGLTADNDEVAIGTTNKQFNVVASKPLKFETRIQFAEGATNKLNVFAGFCSVGTTANTLVDNGAGMVTTYDGAVIYKVDGETVWRCGSSRGTTQYTTTSTKTAGGTSAQVLRIEIQPISTTDAEVTFFVDDAALVDTNLQPIKHTMVFASATQMQAAVGMKLGGANTESLYVDYIAAYQLR